MLTVGRTASKSCRYEQVRGVNKCQRTMSRRETNDTRLVDVISTFLILIGCVFVSANSQQGSVESWDKLSRLIPTNSVYEQQDKNASPASNPAETLLRSLDENNVMETSKTNGKKNEHEEEVDDEEVYEDEYEVETDPKAEHGTSKFSKITDTGSPDINAQTKDASRDEDYLEDPSTSQYDTYNYYNDDYSSPNQSRYQAAADDHARDYLDAEEEGKEVSREQGEQEEQDEAEKPQDNDYDLSEEEEEYLEDAHHANDSTSDLLEEKNANTPIATTNNDQEGSSMEGSDKTFAFLGLPKSGTNSSADSSILIGEAIVSVVTTKSVVNGTISVPTTSSPTTTEQVAAPPSSTGITELPMTAVTTEDTSRILASVQTSRSISGARFLPFPVIDRIESIGHSGEKKTSPAPESTESIIDKLDRVQSELSSGFLAGGFRTAGNSLQLDVLNERDRNNRRRYTTTARTPVISKFVPRRYNDKRTDHATPKPRIETTLDSLEGLLPRDYVTRSSSTTSTISKTGFRWPTKSTTSTTTESITTQLASTTSTTTTKKPKTNVIIQDISAFLPPGYKLKKEDSPVTESSLLKDILARSKVNISSLLPADYNKKKNEEITTAITTTTTTAESIDVSSEKSPAEKTIQNLFANSKVDISSLLPRDYEEKRKNLTLETKDETKDSTESNVSATTESASSTTKKSAGLKLVFPSRPGGRKPANKITTPSSPRGEGPGTVTPKIHRGWPIRATTEFTGWPSSSTTPISIEKILEAARTATISSASLIPITEVTSSTTTTSTTTTTPRPTTPGICEQDCEVAGTIKIIGNASWVPELLDRNTQEWQKLANEIEQEMNFIFSKSAVLAKWYKKIRIDSFSEGSILVDYFVELANLEQKINTQDLKVIFHDSLRTYNANRWNETKTAGSIKLGSFTIDPKYTDFVVIPKVTTPQYIEEDDRLVPQWAIAVIVIGVGGLLFIIIFGVSVLVNRHNGSKLKPSVSTIYEEEVAKSMSAHRSSDYSKPVHTIWTDPDVSWNEKSFESTSNKILVEKSFQDNKKYNMYDSWRSEWNGYYYNGSHSSSKYGGYDSTTNLSSRHHPDYDTNF
ncbi:serine-rich adhesin for platelets [Frieseomelitta varia]|uniref:serine-rich adhesin for platelets n=1 Tax=Frieseomelitta varia TaxID=561572 RepID=UPI001CB68617|nr:serine-rich adhesin for platelets [Frieseomelitta varia]